MLKKLLLPILIACSQNIFSQDFSVFFGMGAHATFQNPKNINYILDRYNETRTDCGIYCLSKEMKHLSFTSGPAFNFGFVTNKVLFELNWVGRKRKISAIGDFPNGDEATRQLRFKMHTVGIGIGAFLGEKRLKFLPMLSFDFGSQRIDNRAVQSGDIEEADFEKIQKNLNIGFSISSGILFWLDHNNKIGLMLRPEYQVWAFKEDYVNLNYTINSATAGNDPDELKASINNFGLWLSLMVFIHD